MVECWHSRGDGFRLPGFAVDVVPAENGWLVNAERPSKDSVEQLDAQGSHIEAQSTGLAVYPMDLVDRKNTLVSYCKSYQSVAGRLLVDDSVPHQQISQEMFRTPYRRH